MRTNSARNSHTKSDAAAIAALRANELKNLLGNRAALISTNVWDDVTRQLVGVVSADALIVSQFPSASPIGMSGPVMENEDQTVLSGPVAGDPNE